METTRCYILLIMDRYQDVVNTAVAAATMTAKVSQPKPRRSGGFVHSPITWGTLVNEMTKRINGGAHTTLIISFKAAHAQRVVCRFQDVRVPLTRWRRLGVAQYILAPLKPCNPETVLRCKAGRLGNRSGRPRLQPFRVCDDMELGDFTLSYDKSV